MGGSTVRGVPSVGQFHAGIMHGLVSVSPLPVLTWGLELSRQFKHSFGVLVFVLHFCIFVLLFWREVGVALCWSSSSSS